MLHGCGSIRIHGLDVAVLCDCNICVAKDTLNDLVGHTHPVQIRRQAATKCLPAMPLQTCPPEGRHNDPSRECVHVD
jgi:hypothetical protein